MGHLGFVARSDWRYLLRHAQEAGERGLEGPGVDLEPGGVERAPDAGNYYMAATERGEPAGRWYGPGCARLGFAPGQEVTAEAMQAVYGDLLDPTTGRSLGSRPRRYATFTERLEKLIAAEGGPQAVDDARRKELEFAARSVQREAAHYYDLTFSPTKSWSVLYAGLRAAGLNAEADALWQCLEDGVKVGLDAAMEQACYARVGRHSGRGAGGRSTGRWEKSSEYVLNLWRHHTSRAGDPQLHVHAAVLNRVWIEPDPGRGVKGGWYALDGTAVKNVRAEAAAVASRASEALAAERLGLSFTDRADGKGREITGVDAALNEAFSSRRRAIEPRAAEIANAYRARYGREPTDYEIRQFHAQATLLTRDRKPTHAPTGAELLAVWEAKVRDSLGQELGAVPAAAAVHLLPDPAIVAEPGPWEQVLEQVLPEAERELLVEQALADVGGRLSVWTRADLAASLDVHLPAEVLAQVAAADQRRLLDVLTDAALAHPDAVRVTAPALLEAPPAWRTGDGRGRFEAPAAYDRYTHAATLAREARLVEAAAAPGYPGIAADAVDARLGTTTLRPSQRAAVARVLTSGRAVDLVIGPAGTGKSYTLAELARIWTETVPAAAGADRLTTRPRVLGLATSEAAVRVLREEGITRGLNVHAFLTQHARAAAGKPISAEDRELVTLRAGDLVILDEASMTSTEHVEAVAAAVRAAGAKLVLAGDDRQLGAVEAGGVFGLLAERSRPVVLDEVVRFANAWEGPASLRLRAGDTSVIGEYDRRGRIVAGTAGELLGAARRGFVADHLTGRTALVITPSNEQAAEVASHVRAELVNLGRVEPDGVALGNATRAGVGDLVATRHNRRDLDDGCGGWVANRDTWTVTARGSDGSLTVRRDLGCDDVGEHHWGPEVVLPADYVAEHVELAYAATVHAAQGRTADTCYPIIDAGMGPDALYVALTRARERTLIGVCTEAEAVDVLGPQDTTDRPELTSEAVLAAVIERPREEASASQVLAGEVDARESLARLGPEWAELIRTDRHAHYAGRLCGLLGQERWRQVQVDPAAPALLRAIRAAELAGRDVEELLTHAVGRHQLDTAESLAQVLHHRVEADTPHTALSRDLLSFTELTPALADPQLDGYAKAIAAAMDERVQVLGERVAADPPAWAQALGPVPGGVLERAEWTRRAGVIAGYREQHGWCHDSDPIGPAPHRSAAEDRAGWQQAWTALGRPQEHREVAAATRGELANLIQAWERTAALAPPDVETDLRTAYRTADFCDREARRCHIEAGQYANLGRRAEAEQAVADRDTWRRDEVTCRARAEALEEAAARRAAWQDATAGQARAAQLARAELARRGEPLDAVVLEPAGDSPEALRVEALRVEVEPRQDLTRLETALRAAWSEQSRAQAAFKLAAAALEHAQAVAAERAAEAAALAPLRQALEQASAAAETAKLTADAARHVLIERQVQIVEQLRADWAAQRDAAAQAAHTLAAGPGRLGLGRGRVREAEQDLREWATRWRDTVPRLEGILSWAEQADPHTGHPHTPRETAAAVAGYARQHPGNDHTDTGFAEHAARRAAAELTEQVAAIEAAERAADAARAAAEHAAEQLRLRQNSAHRHMFRGPATELAARETAHHVAERAAATAAERVAALRADPALAELANPDRWVSEVRTRWSSERLREATEALQRSRAHALEHDEPDYHLSYDPPTIDRGGYGIEI